MRNVIEGVLFYGLLILAGFCLWAALTPPPPLDLGL